MTVSKRKYQLGAILLWLFLSTGVFAETTQNCRVDPFEKINRVMFNFNEIVDKWVLIPIATIYNAVLPKPVNKAISNFFNNIDLIPTVLNDVLQLNLYQATSDSWRFAVNSTIGILGFFDVASEIGLEPNSEDLGLTLARWGYVKSVYLVIPFLGPTTFRDGTAFFANYYYLTIYPYINPQQDRYALYFTGIIAKRAELLRFQDVLNQATVDKYVFMRDAYMQRRAYQIQRNKELGDPYLNQEEKESDNDADKIMPVATPAKDPEKTSA